MPVVFLLHLRSTITQIPTILNMIILHIYQKAIPIVWLLFTTLMAILSPAHPTPSHIKNAGATAIVSHGSPGKLLSTRWLDRYKKVSLHNELGRYHPERDGCSARTLSLYHSFSSV